ncbi:alpha/beta-hydrolase [Annulohypoxylon maeteangense]|uniref:alpha/beta-hydrolase n=1 Tax=Annulohypoxylon maeteangense TaxID=1927788 RepID=UPI002008B4D9|nr:alpha/beta-hydrolase [Annulohypoxylon maeteangense]KAI0885494.1 alpha/beta-hydrolase [Annulohypoxylon maeteangense]
MANSTKTNPSPLHRREVFYVGGQYVPDAKGNHSLQGQMYVERLIPEVDESLRKSLPVVFIHGASRSGMDWLTKPDGQPGWASYFLSQGFECYLVDQPFRGRSPWFPGNGTMVAYQAELIQPVFTACQTLGTWPQAKLHTQWPGPGTIGDPIFDQFYRSTLPILNDPVAQETASQAACAALLDRIGKPAILVGHSAGGSIPWLVADIRPSLVKMIVAIEPVGPPFSKMGIMPGPGAQYGITMAPITYDPPVTDPATDFAKVEVQAPGPNLTSCTLQAESPPPRQLVNLKDVRVLVVTSQASYHAQYDWGVARFLRQAGVAKSEYMRLAEKGIYGNGHMMMMEKNSDEVAAEIVRWIDGAIG